MMTQVETSIRAERDEVEQLIATLGPLSGGIWLATDLTTHVHWTILADSIVPVEEAPDGRTCRAFGLVTVRAPDGEPVFLINQGDTLDWIEEGQILAVRELGQESLEIRLERLDDLDARLICAFSSDRQSEAAILHTIAVGHGRLLPIYDEQRPTGNPDVDRLLQTIETTIDARRRLIGPASGTLDVLEQMTRDLHRTLRTHQVRSYIWATVLQEQIDTMRQRLAA